MMNPYHAVGLVLGVEATTDCTVRYALYGIAAAAENYAATSDSTEAMAALDAARAGIIGDLWDCALDWVCDSTTRGPFFPNLSTVACGNPERVDVSDPFEFEGITVTVRSTCWVMTCTTQGTRGVTYRNRCTGSSTSYTENCVSYAVWACCVPGLVGTGPGGQPPCTMTFRRSWVDTLN